MIMKYIYKLRYILIILSALLGLMWLSSSFWYSAWIWTRLQVWDNQISVLPYWNFLTSVWWYSRSVLALPRNTYVFRTTKRIGPYPYLRYNQERPANADFEWFFKWFYSCANFTWIITEAPSDCTWYEFTWSNLNILKAYLEKITYDDFRYVDNLDWDRLNPSRFVLCMSTQVWRSICLSTYANSNLWEASLHLWELNQSWSQIPQGYIWSSPWAPWYSLSDNQTSWFENTNKGVYDAYWEAWYYRGLCYSDFSINSLATLSWGLQQFYENEREDWEYYTGARITDLRLFYASGMDFATWFNYRYVNYKNSLALANTSINPAVNYVWKSKGLWNMAYKFYLAWLWSDNLTYTKLYNYCSYYQDFNFNDGGGDIEYSGPELPDNVSILVQNNLQFWTWILWHFTGDDQSFDAESFFNELTTKLNDLLGSPDDSYRWIIPPYILMVLLALIFIRLISH